MISYMHIYAHCTSMSRNKKCPGPICLLELKRDETNGIAKQVHSKARDLRVHASYRCPIFQHNFGARLKMEHTPMAGTFSREHGDKPSNSGVPMGYLWVPYFQKNPFFGPCNVSEFVTHSFEVETLRNHLLRSKERRKSHDVRDADNQTHKPEVAGQRRIRQDVSEKTSDKTGCLKWVMLGMDHS